MKNVLALFLFMSTLHGQTPLDPLIDSLIQRSRTFTDEQDFDQALESGIQAEKIALEKFGKESVAYGNTSFNHGRVLYFQKIYEEAEYWYLESKTIREKVLGKAHPDYGKSVNNLAVVYDEIGLYEKAEPLYLEVLALRESLFGKESDPYANVLSNLASLYMQMGQYEKSEVLSLEAKDIRERVLGKSAPAYASSLINLANLYYVMHNYKQAELLYQEAIAIRENVGEKESIDYILGLGNLGVLYQITGQYDKAQPLLIEAKNLGQKNLGESQPIFVLSLNHLANLYKDMQDYPKAEAFFLQAQAIGEKVMGKEHPDNILNQESLGVLYYESAQYAKAEPLLLECNALYAKVLGKAHPYFATNLDFLAQLYWLSGKLDTAKFYLTEAAKTKRLLLEKASRHLSEQELAAYIDQFADGLSRNCAFAARHSGLNTVCYDDILFYKGFLLNSVSQLQKLALTHPDATEKYNLLKSCQRRLAAEYTKPIAERTNVEVLENQAGKLEKELVRNIAGYGAATNQFNWQEVQAKLQPEEAAIEFIHYKSRNPQAFALNKSMPPMTDSIRYAAILLRSGAKEPVFIPLFEEQQLSTLLQTEGKPKQDFINTLYAVNTDPGESLYSLIWKPLESSLNGVSTLYFSPSGLLHRLNLGAIPLSPVRGQETGATFSERFQLVELGSTRQLALSSAEKTNDQEAILYGGIRYEMDSTTSTQSISDLKDKSFTSRRGLDFSNTDTTYRGAQWNYLKWTDVEVRSIEALLTDAGMRPTLYNGRAATEESFKKIGRKTPAPRILHLATHGFFFPDPKHQNQAILHKEQEPVFKRSDHPMIRSGLILAGGNHAWTTGLPIQAGMEDGILTAYEISQMNLSNTELVVLSACETGLGDIQGNEGVYGLQRAFKIAGAKYLIMSLWQVPDFQTQELTTTFYSRWMDDKMTVPEAFRSAQKAMREKYKDPFWWAGFVLVE